MKMVTGYFKVFGLAEDEHGNKDYTAMSINLKVSDDYDGETDVSNSLDLSVLAKNLNCRTEDIIPMSREEYEQEFGADE